MHQISIHPGDLFDRIGIDAGFEALAKAGIEAIQFGLGRHFLSPTQIKENLPALMDSDLDTVLEAVRPYKEAAKKYGVAISQVHAPFPIWIKDNDFANSRMPDALKKSIAITAYLDCPHCVIHPAWASPNAARTMPDEEWELNRKLYSDLIPTLKQYDVIALLENMFTRGEGGVVYGAACADYFEASRYVDDLNAIAGETRFGFCLDTGHCLLVRQNLTRAVNILGHRLLALHMQDISGYGDDHRAPFTGITNWVAFLDELKAIGYQGDLNFEAHNAVIPYPTEMLTEALAILGATGRYFKKYLSE